jgi:hypothetical protein
MGRDARVRDQGPVAQPRQGFGTHDGCDASGRKLFEATETGREALGLHVIRVSAEGSIAPAAVDGAKPRVA